MATVTQRIKQVKQPRGGYLNRKSFEVEQLEPDELIDTKNESVAPQTIGLVVDYLTRMILNKDARKAFSISLTGAEIAEELKEAESLLSNIKDNDDQSIINACELVKYDTVYRAGLMPPETKIPDHKTINNIKSLVDRSLSFFEKIGEFKEDGFTFEGGYTETIHAGDGDFLTEDTLWDFKVSKQVPQKDTTLQLVIYYLMGKASKNSIFDNIRYIGIFNPRLNRIYKYDMKKADPDMINTIKREVIGYEV
ncbi:MULTISPECIES: hypothetical protein [Staphylococcus]|uniref:Uncharacterized protein n=1 Tax=Staphylococcus pettenkoferi TaxID=170573 RepID=A0A2N6QHG0_9STAP|nr:MULTISPECIES: hypothetical protein [Staphylococcus]MBX8993061.1 hypothetical protein [Staphylococcus pettenkoferi]MCI2791514.1 hypothetical protein [Staphylococcus pettenkoferi]MCY1567213.1 hypothetical protein [Staphylococcus pettenkoferi]MCY1588443.1 hypothetical protein [Staphylococcus pettenkoferi]OFK76671.1 hypothetical protein HMPREF2802_10635 [Staphylococcus sp. HMSC071G07]